MNYVEFTTGRFADFRQLSRAFLRIYKECQGQDIAFIVLDRDGPAVEGIRQFQW